jgi:hypothetical protein
MPNGCGSCLKNRFPWTPGRASSPPGAPASTKAAFRDGILCEAKAEIITPDPIGTGRCDHRGVAEQPLWLPRDEEGNRKRKRPTAHVAMEPHADSGAVPVRSAGWLPKAVLKATPRPGRRGPPCRRRASPRCRTRPRRCRSPCRRRTSSARHRRGHRPRRLAGMGPRIVICLVWTQAPPPYPSLVHPDGVRP